MNHLHRISKEVPVSASRFQQFLCQINQMFSGMIGALGGNSPKVSYTGGKCNLTT
ncbi:MAG TPA: hypothetical protein PLO62_09530 [Candidatus Hydrogenedentes bacterium]|nr:hypothetical protein [Candidatus Hydrogenedentota bacterium]HOS03367.1 hypothetical protein [Candidatus Hydrogenedentota bacterium]